MDITNQLIAGLEKTSTTLDSLDAGLATLVQSVNRFSEISSAAAEKEQKAEEARAKAAERSKARKKKAEAEEKRRIARETELARLTKEERIIKAATLRFNRKYNKEIEKIQNKFSSTISLATKVQKTIIDVNKKYNVELRQSIKNHIENNKILVSFKKSSTLFSAGLTVATQKLKNLPGVAVAGRGVSAIGRGIGQGAKQAGNVIGGIAGKIGGLLPIAGILAVPGLIIRQLMKVDQAFSQIAISTGLTGKNLQFVQNSVENATASTLTFGIGLDENAQTAGALTEALGNADYVTSDLVQKMSMLSKATGMSSQEAGELAKTLIKGFGATTDDVESFANNMMNFASKSGVNARKVMRDISNDSNLTSIYLGRGENYLANAAVLAAKMGKSLSEQNQTLDAFRDMEASIENVAEINKLTGSSLDAQKMYMMYQTQDTLGVMRELQKAFSNPRAIAMINRYPGAFKDIAASLNLSVADLKQLDRVMRDFEKTSGKSSAQQDAIKAALNDSSTIMNDIKNIMLQVLLPAFNHLGNFIRSNIRPALNVLKEEASKFGQAMQSAMAGEDTLVDKFRAAFRVLLETAKPLIKGIFDEMMVHLRPKINELMVEVGNFIDKKIVKVSESLLIAVNQATNGVLGLSREEIDRNKLVDELNELNRQKIVRENPDFNERQIDMKVAEMSLRQFESKGIGATADSKSNEQIKDLLEIAKAQQKVIEKGLFFRQSNPLSIKADEEQRAFDTLGIGRNAKGNVYNRPTLGLIGEEGRSEVIIPTERIRKGLPVNPSVARELQSIGVPGYSMGTVRVSGESATTAANTFQMNQQRRALLYSQGDPEAVRRTERKIEQQAAEIRAQQRKILNEIVKINNEADFQGYFGGGPAGMPTGGGGERDPRRRQKNRFHDYATTLDNFMMLTGYTFGDFFDMLPNVIEKPIETAFNKLPEAMRDGLTTGTQAAWDAYIATGNFEKALETGVQTGLLTYGTKEKATLSGQIGLLGSEYLRTGSLRTSAASTLQSSMYDNSSFFGSSYGGAQGRINRQQQLSSISEEDFYTSLADEQEEFLKAAQPRLDAAHQELLNAQKNTAEILKRQELEKENFEAEKAAAAQRFELYKNSETYQQNDAYQAARLRERENELVAFEQRTAEMERKNVEAQKKAQEKEDIALEAQTEARMKYNEGAAKLNKKQADAIEEYEDNTKLSGKLLKDAAKDQAMMGGMEGVLRALQEGEGVEGAIKTGLSSAAGGAAQGAITAGLTASGVPAPIAGLVGKFGGQFVGKGVGKALGFLGLGGKNVKPKKAGIKIADIVVDGLARASAPGNQLSDFFSTGSNAHRVIQGNIMLASQKPDTFVEPIRRALQSNSGRRFSKDETLSFIQLLYGKGMSPAVRDQQLDNFEGMLEGRAPTRAGASGAIVSRPTVALIGEAGPEALMPLENAPGARPLNGVGSGGNNELLQELKRMNQMLAQMANRPIQLDGQRVNTVLNTVNSDDIRAGIYTVNSR